MTKKNLSTNIKEMLKIRVYKNTKNPYAEDWSGTNSKNYNKDFEANDTHNIGIPTGKVNNCIVVDLDSYKWKDTHPFFILYNKETFINDINTYSVETPSRGYHLFFPYDKDIKNVISKKYQIDLFTDNKYVVGYGSKVKGKMYRVINDVDIKPMPQKLKDFLMEVIREREDEPSKKTKKTKTKKVKNNKYDFEFYLGNNITFSDDDFLKILSKLPNEYINDFDKWITFTASCKALNKKDVWDKLSSKSTSYNYDNNNKLWDRLSDKDTISLKHILEVCKSDLGNSIKYMPLLKSNMVANKTYNRKRLGQKIKNGENINAPVIKDDASYVIRSDTGSGKSYESRRYFKDVKDAILSIVDRQTLSYSQYDEFNKNGLDFQHYKLTGIKENQNSIICINSLCLKKYKIDEFISNKTILYLDEITATIKTLVLSPTFNNNRMNVFQYLRQMIANCKQLVAVDADIDSIILNWLKRIRKDIKYINNTKLHNKGVEAIELDQEHILISKLKKEKKFMLCCDSATKAESIWKKLGDKSVVLITDSKINDIQQYVNLDMFDKVIFSPKIIRGIDSQMKRNVYVYYREMTIMPDDMIQQFTRCRNINKLFFIFTRKNFKKCPSFEEHAEEVKEQHEYARQYKDEREELFRKEYMDLYIKLSYNQRAYESNKYIHFIKLLNERGFIVKQIFTRTKINGMTKKEKEEARQERLNEFDMDKEKYKLLNDKYLHIPHSKVYENDKIKDVFINQHQASIHFNLCKYLYKNEEQLIKELQRHLEYNINKYTSASIKINYLKKLFSVLDISFDNLMINDYDKEALSELEKEYYILFKDRSKRNFTDEIQKIVIKIIKQLFGKDIIKSKRVMSNGERYHEYTINESELNFHKYIYSFRGGNVEPETDKRLF